MSLERAESTDELMRAVASSELGRIQRFVLVSDTHSKVWRADTDHGAFSVKLLSDTSSTVSAERIVLDAVSWLPTVCPMLKLLPFRGAHVIISRYIEGESLDRVLARGAYDQSDCERWIDAFSRLHRAVADLDGRGFGRCSDATMRGEYATWSEFLRQYLQEQRAKAPRNAAWGYARISSFLEQVADPLNRAVKSPRVVLADVNNRNFIVRARDRELTLINAPVIWLSDPAQPHGEALLHFDRTPLTTGLLERSEFPRWRLHFYAAFNAYVILAYAERFAPTAPDEVAPWGRERPLRTLFDEHLAYARAHLPAR